MNVDTKATNYWNAVKNLQPFFRECVALVKEIRSQLTPEINKIPGAKCGGFGGELEVSDNEGWISLSLLNQVSVREKKRGRGTNVGWLYYLLVIGQEEYSPASPDFPFLEIGYEAGGDPWDDAYSLLDGPGEEDNTIDYCLTADGRLLVGKNYKTYWKNDDAEFYFILPLFSLRSRKDIKNFVVKPTMDLLTRERGLQDDPPFVFEEGHPALRLKKRDYEDWYMLDGEILNTR